MKVIIILLFCFTTIFLNIYHSIFLEKILIDETLNTKDKIK